MTDLPLDDDTAQVVYAGHVLEHLDYATDLPAALAEAARVLAPGGRLVVVGPDANRAKAWRDDGRMTDAEYQVIVHGEGDRPGMVHMWRPTAQATQAAVTASGLFDGADVLPIQSTFLDPYPVVSRIGWQFALVATVAADTNKEGNDSE